LNRSIRGIVLNEQADDQARFDMFERINTGSLMANTAEIRRGALRGPFQSLVEELAKDPAFAELAPMPKSAEDARTREELVTRFFAYGDGLENYKDSPSRFIFEYTERKNQELGANPDEEAVLRQRWADVIDFVRKAFPMGFRKQENSKSTPRVRFEAIAIGSWLALQEKPELAEGPAPNVAGWIESEEFKEVTTSDAANVKSKIERRLEFVRDKLLEV
jgi:hypothetical protein